MALPPSLSAKFKGSFAYVTIKDRLPIILTKAIDATHRARHNLILQHGEEVTEAVKAVVAEFSELRYRMATDKPFVPISSTLPDTLAWNARLEQEAEEFPAGDGPSWFKSSWLTAECYMYRKIAAAFEHQPLLRDYDPFRVQKEAAFESSRRAMAILAEYLQDAVATDLAHRHVLENLVQMSLWGNKCDLSISAGEIAHKHASPVEQVADLKSMILVDDLERVLDTLLASQPDSSIAIVLDNAGLELFGDLCLAEFLLHSRTQLLLLLLQGCGLWTSGLASRVVLHGKALPWFVSDTTASDLEWTLARLTASPDPALAALGTKWTARLRDGSLQAEYDPFWTLPHPYCEMAAVAPELHAHLAKQSFIFFKGDLNYRKLVSDLDWPKETRFSEGLRGFQPAPLVSLRTLKADLCLNLKPGEAEELNARTGGGDWLLTGDYAIISLHTPLVRP